jgi:hypothetical protein
MAAGMAQPPSKPITSKTAVIRKNAFMALHLIDGLTTRPAQFPSKISPAHAGSNIIINGADLFPL